MTLRSFAGKAHSLPVGRAVESAEDTDVRHHGAQFLYELKPEVEFVAAPGAERKKIESVMSKLAIAFTLALIAIPSSANDKLSAQSHTPAVASVNGKQPFLFDGRM